MAITKLSDIISGEEELHEVWKPYFIERTAEKSELIKSGIVVPDPELDTLAQTGGMLINMPFFKDLSGDDDRISDVEALGVNKITSGKDVARLLMRGKAWGASDLSKALSGADPLGAIADLVADYWNRREQVILTNVLDGVFADNAANDSSDLISNIAVTNVAAASIPTTALIGPDQILDAKVKLGDAADKLTAIMMHSTPFTRLQKLNLIEMVPDSDGKVKIPYYLGLRVIVDDGCPKVYANGTNATNGYIYTTYLFGAGAIGRGEGNAPVPIETDRDSLAGEDYLINRRHFILHPRGIRWMENTISADTTPYTQTAGQVNGTSPANADLALAANWNRVYEQKNIRIVALKTNG